MCEDDRANLCAAVAWGGGRVEQCLKDKRAALSPRCKRELFRREVEESETALEELTKQVDIIAKELAAGHGAVGAGGGGSVPPCPPAGP